MAVRLDIDNSTILDNIDERQVEFTGEVDGDEYEFAVQYDVLEALTGDAPDGDAVDTFQRYIDPISDAALSALSRNSDQAMIVVSENDLD
jgi:inhibitor of KinA sporulation pathway (predicted exonuclease)